MTGYDSTVKSLHAPVTIYPIDGTQTKKEKGCSFKGCDAYEGGLKGWQSSPCIIPELVEVSSY